MRNVKLKGKEQMKTKTWIALFIGLILIGCGDSEHKKAKKKVANPLKAQVEAIKKAKNVEKTILDASKKQRQALKKMEDGAGDKKSKDGSH